MDAHERNARLNVSALCSDACVLYRRAWLMSEMTEYEPFACFMVAVTASNTSSRSLELGRSYRRTDAHFKTQGGQQRRAIHARCSARTLCARWISSAKMLSSTSESDSVRKCRWYDSSLCVCSVARSCSAFVRLPLWILCRRASHVRGVRELLVCCSQCSVWVQRNARTHQVDAERRVHVERLRLLRSGTASRRVAHVADAHGAVKHLHCFLLKHVLDQAVVLRVQADRVI